MRVLKVALIVFFSIVGAVGIIVLGLYLGGKLNEQIIPPADIFYAKVTIDEEGNKTFVARTEDYFTANNFEVTIGTTSDTSEYTQNLVSLDFGTTVAKKYLKIDNETLTPYCYTLDADGKQIKYVLVEEGEASYITNGKIVVPKNIKIGRAFEVRLCVAPEDDFEGVIDENTKLYNIGGTVVLYAQSEAKSLSRINATINIDVPVESIKILPTTGNGSDDKTLDTITDGEKTYYVVNLETYFGMKVEFTPSRSVYLYGKDGTIGTAQFKQVIFGLNNDEDNIALVDENGTVVVGVSNVARLLSLLSGDGQVFARVFKTAIDYEENGNSTLSEKYDLMANIGTEAKADIRVTNITIDGFEAENDFHGVGKELVFDINKRLIITANNQQLGKSLGINILAEGYSQGAVQKEIENIYLSIQVFKNGAWVDATSADNKYFAFIGSQIFVMDIVDSDYYGFNFYQVKFNRNLPNNSYWEIASLANNENADYSAVRIQIFYMSNEGLVEDNPKYGPYDIDCVVNPVIEPNVEWNDAAEFKKSNELIADEKNERILFYQNGVAQPIVLDLTNLAVIKNLNENPSNTLIKYFVCSKNDANLDSKINCKKYLGEIQGFSSEIKYVYELLSDERLIISSMGDVSEFEFDIVFAVVQNDFYGNAIKDGENYVIKVLPSAENGSLITLPFKISKTVDIGNDSLSITLDKAISPYGEPIFVLQRTENSLTLSIKIKTNDVEIFKKQVNNGNITLNAVENEKVVDYLYYLNEGVSYSLTYALSTYLDTNPTSKVENEYTIYDIKLSTNEIVFGENEDEKTITIVLNYKVDVSDEEIIYTAKSSNLNIYSGKIIDLNIKYSYKDKEDQTVEKYFVGNETIKIIKRITNATGVSEISTVYKMEIDGELTEIELLEDNFLKVDFTKYGIDDVLNVSSSNSLVLQVSYMSIKDEIKYQLSALKSGNNVEVSFKPQFAHSRFNEIKLIFDIDANFEIDSDDAQSRKNIADLAANDGILSYDENRGYTIIGAPIKQIENAYEIVDVANANVNYLFKDLVDIWVKTSDTEPISVKDKLKFTVEIPDDLKTYIELIEEDGEIVGFKPVAKLGNAASLVVYYYSSEIGFNSGIININLKPYYQSQGNIENHEGANASQKEPDAKFVFAEAEILLENFKVLGFNLATGKYDVKINIGFAAKIASIVDQLTAITCEENNLINILTIFANKNDFDTFYTPTKIIFEPVTTVQKYVLTIAFNDNTPSNAYNFSIDYIFYVEPNIKVDETKVETKNENGKEIYYLNNQQNPFKNGDIIYWVNDGSTGKNVFECPFVRNFGTENFNSNKFGYKLYEVGNISNNYIKGENLTISSVKKLSLFELVINYSGVEFTFRFYAQPNLALPEGVDKVIYNNKEYISLYAGQDISGFTTINFGKLIEGNYIKSYGELCKLTGVVNSNFTTYGGGQINIVKNSFDLFETYIVLVSGNGTEYIVYNALIFPEKWAYIQYKTDETDVYKILAGKVVNEISSGENIKDYFANGIFDNGFKYEIYDITEAKILEQNNSFINIDTESKMIKTNPIGKDHEFKITFTVQYLDNQNKVYEYSFDYFVKAKKSQEITINYPYSTEKNSDDFSVSHKIYYDEFVEGQYTINLASNRYNLLGKKFVKLTTSGTGDFNTLKYEISKVFVNNEEIKLSDFSKYVEINKNGNVTLKNVSYEPLNIIIKIYTVNGAENNYKISVQNHSVNYVIGKEYEEIGFVENDITKILRKDLASVENETYRIFSLSDYQLRIKDGSSYSPSDLTLNFAVLKDGILQDNSQIIYYDSENKQIVVQSSPNKQTATLYAFTAEGIVATINLDMDSPIVIEQTKANYDGGENDIKGLYGDKTVDLFDYLKISYNGSAVSTNISSEFKLITGNNYVSISGSTLTIKPFVGNSFTIQINVKLWGETLPGTNETTYCTFTLNFTIMPNIEVVNQTANATANEEFTWADLSKLFVLKENNEGYFYSSEGFTYNLNAEELGLYGDDGIELSLQDNSLSFTPKAVIADRQIVVTITITKGDFSTTGTLTITIKPDTTVSVEYPNYETGKTFNSLYIYNKDYSNTTLNSIIGGCITLSKDGKTFTLNVISGENYLTIDKSSGEIKLTEAAQNITDNQTVIIQILVDDLLRDTTINVTICKNPVFTARFEDNSNNLQESLLASEVKGNPFWFVDGKLSIEAVKNREGSQFAIYVIAKDRLTGTETKVLIGGTGTADGGLINLYFVTSNGLGDNITLENDAITGENRIYSLSTIFAGKNINFDTCEFYFGEFIQNQSGVVENAGLSITQPTKKITYFYNGYEMPFSEAKKLFKIKISETKNTDLDFFALSSTAVGTTYKYTVVNVASGQEIASYTYNVVKDYKLNENLFANSPASDSTSATTKDTYKANEFNGYGSTYKVSKTIELTAGNSYSLVDLLKNYLGLTSFRNGNYTSKEKIYLTHGEFTTNSNFATNLGSLISLQGLTNAGNVVDYTITPNGAQKGGDIVHLVVRFGAIGLKTKEPSTEESETTKLTDYSDEDTYIIRINIIPSITINPTSASGEIILSYGGEGETSLTTTGLTLIGMSKSIGTNSGGKYYNVPLSKLVTLGGNYDITKMIVSVGEGSKYVVGSGYANRLGKLPNDEYGIQFNKTIFGGNIIVLTISDRFGYAETVKVQYLNEKQVSPTILSQPQSVYEGEELTLAIYTGTNAEDGKKEYRCFGATEGGRNETALSSLSNVIIIDGFDDNKIIKIDGDFEKNLICSFSAKKGKITGCTLGYNDSNIFESNISILPSTFGLKVTLKVNNPAIGENETVELDINTSLNQRYKIQANSPYSKYSTIYLPNRSSYNPSDLFTVYDLKEGAVVTSVSFTDNSSKNGFLKVSGNTKTFEKDANDKYQGKTTEAKETKLTFNLTIGDDLIRHTYTFAIAITPTYYEARMEGNDVDSTYGIVVDGTDSGSYNRDDWKNSIKYYDYYGNNISDKVTATVEFSKKSGTGTLKGNTLSALDKNSPVTINVVCDGVNIGEVLVTMRRYYGLDSGTTSVDVEGVTTTNKLTFDQWANGIQALVVGSGEEAIGGGLFSYSIKTSETTETTETTVYDIIFENNQYSIIKKSGDFVVYNSDTNTGDLITINVYYMSTYLGTITVKVKN